MLKPITIPQGRKTRTVRCRHADVWPPGWSKSGRAVEDLRQEGLLDAEQYERAKTWERVCGMQAMQADKCMQCPHALWENGLPVVPQATPTAPGNPGHRKRRKKVYE
jgi:hypothetical protein